MANLKFWILNNHHFICTHETSTEARFSKNNILTFLFQEVTVLLAANLLGSRNRNDF